MLKQFTRGEWKVEVTFELAFDDGCNNGFGFPCDFNGKPLPGLTKAAEENLAWCKEHPEKFERAGEIITLKRRVREPDMAVCECFQTFEVFNQYYGACQCPRCGRWYNLFGQELLPPDQWEDDPSESEY